MNTPFEDDIIDNKKVIDFHTHPYTCRDEYMRGFAHGFLVLSDEAEFCYKCDDFYRELLS